MAISLLGFSPTHQSWRRRMAIAFVVVALAISTGMCWFAAKQRQVDRQRDAVKAINDLGGWVLLDNECDDRGFPRTERPRCATAVLENPMDSGLPIVAGEPSGPAWMRRFVGDEFFSFARSARIENDAAMTHLATLSQLEFLFLSGSRVSNTGVRHLAKLQSLRCLDMQCTHTNDDGLEHIGTLNNLEELYLGGADVTDAGLKNLKGLAKLRKLDLTGTNVTAAGIEYLQQALPNVQIISGCGER